MPETPLSETAKDLLLELFINAASQERRHLDDPVLIADLLPAGSTGRTAAASQDPTGNATANHKKRRNLT